MLPPNWKTILNDIEKERAVLLIGPDFWSSHEQSVASVFYAHLTEHLDVEATHFFERDGLFIFDTAVSKMDAQTEAEAFFKNLPMDEAVLALIAELPFPLIISVNPDLVLPQYFSKRQVHFQFDYFSTKDKATPGSVTKPSAASPLIYNLCGSIEDYQSLVLDFDDLFDMLKNLLGDFGVPKVVNDHLVNATTYIFIGFEFDKWYTQLLLRYMNKNRDRFSNAKKNYASKTIVGDEDTKTFFQQQFNLTIYGGDWQFLHELHKEYAASKKIRPLLDPVSDRAAMVRRLVQFNNIEDALERLEEYTADLPERDEVTMYKANYNAWLAEYRDRTATQENLDVKIARIRKGILDLTQKLP
ncbi:MAG: SIR2 family protein [Saprospiraceae bacterium]